MKSNNQIKNKTQDNKMKNEILNNEDEVPTLYEALKELWLWIKRGWALLSVRNREQGFQSCKGARVRKEWVKLAQREKSGLLEKKLKSNNNKAQRAKCQQNSIKSKMKFVKSNNQIKKTKQKMKP